MTPTRSRGVNATDLILLIRINRLYHPGMSALELYEATRGIWRVGGTRRNRVKYALAIFAGTVLEVYSVSDWAPAGTSRYRTRNLAKRDLRHRWEFTGSIATKELRSYYRGLSVAHWFQRGNRNPVNYRKISQSRWSTA